MTDELKEWLEQSIASLRTETLRRAPNMLPDAEALDAFLAVLMACVGKGAGEQLHAIQSWALNNIGHDTALATDWLTVFRSLKDVIGDALSENFVAEDAFIYWRELDRIFNYAIVETTRLASDVDRVTLLEHMVDLRRQMERLNRSKASFVTVAAHELRTPLTLLEGYANMMEADLPNDKPQLRNFLEGFRKGTHRLHEVITDMIDMAMIDSNSLAIHYQPVHLEKLLQLVVNNLAHSFAERNIELIVDPLVVRGIIYGDPERLHQAFSKIVSNALKFTPDGGRVAISSILTRPAEVTDEIAGYVDIQISDTGIGINQEDLESIFEKFSRTTDIALHSSGKTKFKGGGPGLGLSIARGIIEGHGGRVWAESPGCDEKSCPGSTFHIELPIRLRAPVANEF